MPKRKRSETIGNSEPVHVGELVSKIVEDLPADTPTEPKPKRPKPQTKWEAFISLEDRNDGPTMHLGRNEGFQQMQIKFDQKPPAEARQKLHDAGWQWHDKDKVWLLPLDREKKWATHSAAQRLFREIGNDIRAKNGLDPVQLSSPGR
jgi:hypothetical protein